jgi:hypothetical protein
LTLYAVEIDAVVRIVDVPELLQSQIRKVHRSLMPDYRQGPRTCKYLLLFYLLHLPTSGLNHSMMAVRLTDRTAIIPDGCLVFWTLSAGLLYRSRSNRLSQNPSPGRIRFFQDTCLTLRQLLSIAQNS